MTRLDLTCHLNKRPDAWSAMIVSGHLASVLLPLYLCAWSGFGLQLILAWVWVGTGMNGLLNLMHECAHYHVFRERAGSQFLGRWILGPLALADFDAYQKRHWIHHRQLGEAEDPKYIYRRNIRGQRCAAFALRCLGLVEALKKFTGQTLRSPSVGGTPSPPSRIWILRTVVVQGLLGGSLLLMATLPSSRSLGEGLWAGAAAYGGGYLYGLASLTVWVASLRAIAEHQITDDGATNQKDAALRNFQSGRILGWLLGSYGFVQHATHHFEPAIPYYNLPAATTALAAANPAFAPRHTYGRVLGTVIG